MTRRALFLDRDGVLVADAGVGGAATALVPLPGVTGALRAARAAGYLLLVVTNQPIVARGLASEDEVRAVNARLGEALARDGAGIDAFYFCPHHPRATLPAYRLACACRKPRPGMLRTAAFAWSVDLASSVMIGDRLSDVAAGRAAGCRAILVATGMHDAPLIESPDDFAGVRPDVTAPDLAAAVAGLLGVPA